MKILQRCDSSKSGQCTRHNADDNNAVNDFSGLNITTIHLLVILQANMSIMSQRAQIPCADEVSSGSGVLDVTELSPSSVHQTTVCETG